MEHVHHGTLDEDLVFVTSAATVNELKAVGLLIDSIRCFGGELSRAPVWLILDSRFGGLPELPDDERVEIFEMHVQEEIRGYELAGKVSACAEAEKNAPAGVRSIVWLSPDTLTVNPPTQFILDGAFDAALRPVHVKNIGLAIDESLNGYWKGIMGCAGIADTDYTVESFVDCQKVRAYFNSHSFCVNPSTGIFGEWLDCFTRLVGDREYQDEFCSDELHRIFLHQAVLSAVTVAKVSPSRIRILPSTYSYPYNLQPSIPAERKANSMNQLTTVVYEDLPLDPEMIREIEVEEPLRGWLAEMTSRKPPD